MVNFKHPDEDEPLTEEEIRVALLKVKIEKARQRREQEYLDKLSKPKEYHRFTASDLWKFVLTRIKETVPRFALDEQNRKVFEMLCLYFAGDPKFETNYLDEKGEQKYWLNKGIALLGPVGCGKTTMMRAFAINSHNGFHEVNCRKVADDYSLKNTGGALAINYYSELQEAIPDNNFGQRKVGFFFDDLGTETNKKHFGNEVNIMEEVILNRYEKASLHNKTHLTSNLSAADIERMYGPRFRSRLRGMFNMIAYEETAGDRRI